MTLKPHPTRTFITLLFLVALSASGTDSVWSQPVTRFMVVADAHVYSPVSDFTQTILYELALEAINGELDFIFFAGDLIIHQPLDSTRLDSALMDWRFVLDTLKSHDIRVYACRGNNDTGSGYAWDTLFSGDYAFPENGPEGERNRTYALTINNVLFLSLDQYFSYHRINQVWLDEILQANQPPHVFAAGHEPAFKLFHSGVMGMYPEERDQFWESLSDARAKIFFCGHDHFYDHAILKDSTGMLPSIHQVIVGTGGGGIHSDSEFNGENGRWKPERIYHAAEHGYALVKVIGPEVSLAWMQRMEPFTFEEAGDSYSFSDATPAGPPSQSVKESVYNAPNPFHSGTTIRYLVSSPSKVKLEVFNIHGQKISILVNQEVLPGRHEVLWAAENVPPGIYFCKMETISGTQVIRMLLSH